MGGQGHRQGRRSGHNGQGLIFCRQFTAKHSSLVYRRMRAPCTGAFSLISISLACPVNALGLAHVESGSTRADCLFLVS